MKGKLSLREYSAAFLLVPMVLGLIITFSGGVFNTFDAELEDEGVEDIRSSFESSQPDAEQRRSELEDVDTRTDVFFLRPVWNVIGGVATSASNIYSLATMSIGMLNLPGEVLALASIVVVGVIFEIVSLARGYQT